MLYNKVSMKNKPANKNTLSIIRKEIFQKKEFFEYYKRFLKQKIKKLSKNHA